MRPSALDCRRNLSNSSTHRLAQDPSLLSMKVIFMARKALAAYFGRVPRTLGLTNIIGALRSARG